MSESAFERLNKVNCNDHTEKKNNLTYLSWAWAWTELKKLYPKSYYTIYEDKDGLFYHSDGKTCWVKTGVTLVDGDYSLEHIEYLPVMDYKNKSILKENVTSFEVNKAIQRSLTKAVARHGLGLYIYAGEDLPEEVKDEDPKKGEKEAPSVNEGTADKQQKPAQKTTPVNESTVNPPRCADCGAEFKQTDARTAQELAKASKEKFKRPLCAKCAREELARRKSQQNA